MRKTKRMISLLLAVLITVGVMSGITVHADTDPAAYFAEKVTAGDISDGDKLFICVDSESVALGTEFSAARIKPKNVTLGSDRRDLYPKLAA